ncbi:MAG: hypothetical protein JW791_02260 [Nanoarchaeota archaeon]|nr:hypothetical protein [Nanoarchaeota archaeon]
MAEAAEVKYELANIFVAMKNQIELQETNEDVKKEKVNGILSKIITSMSGDLNDIDRLLDKVKAAAKGAGIDPSKISTTELSSLKGTGLWAGIKNAWVKIKRPFQWYKKRHAFWKTTIALGATGIIGWLVWVILF